MILVNNPGNWDVVYPPLLHAEWNGWTPTDLIYPFFLFIVGVSMSFSFGRRLESGTRQELYLQVVRRTAIIFALGIFLNLVPSFDLADLRIAGVLQRIAVVYLFASLIVMNCGVKARAWITAGILILYWGLMTLVPVPGYGAGVLTPEGNLAAWLDSQLLPGRMWQGTWDPEGILSTLPAIATTLLGVLTGSWLRSGQSRLDIAAWMFIGGWIGILSGVFWGVWFPINKNIWTSPYVLFTTGAALHFLGVCYWLIDVKNIRRWAYPAIVFGMNAIALYVLADIVSGLMSIIPVSGSPDPITLKEWIFGMLSLWFAPVNASLVFALGYVVFWFFLMNLLYRRKIFIKI
jgi:predicted acyltransferase